ncbi:hypothetical protein ACTWPT_53970 [Nonomuraea sp. 3N208]|uniref:hypothetical protein n=1 Tax=unclassified Nonomuraea TaxID=2593643 RepID=UPI00273C507E|nr:hypothetical protein [Nonomuraea sp. G32]MDP4507967.1 hypothetical protein [Nonomuraea sp. G32]
MNENPEELPEAVGGVEGESDVVAERSGAETPRARRPVPADPPEIQDQPAGTEGSEAGSQAGTQEESRVGAGKDSQEDPQRDAEEVTRPDAGPTG